MADSNFPGISGGFATPYGADVQQFQNIADKVQAFIAFRGLAEDVGTGTGAGSMGGTASAAALGLNMPWYMKLAIGAAAVAAVLVLTKKGK